MESNRFEYKRELTDGLEKEVIAFLNYHDGGLVYIGVDAAGDVYGVPNCDAVQLVIKDRLKNNIQPSCLGLFDVIHETRDGKNIIKLIIASGSGMPRILKAYPREAYTFSSRFIRAAFPISREALELEHEVTEDTAGKKYRKGLQEATADKRLEESRLESG